jgi:hypothetical protein
MWNPFKKKQLVSESDLPEKKIDNNEEVEKINRGLMLKTFENMDWSQLFDDPKQEGLMKLLPAFNLIIGIIIIVLLIKK